ncbi:hypothetical protein NSQ91_22890 [Paenibacillus sp. FSL R7-0048]|jgi:hypothetical protein|uniref:Lipoprotein n=1 Tax=Paenibacillus odorifer TaxID=189426 RepID=A0ABX3GVT1_9BACL|nr:MULTISPECIES: hypothetical protein [Paenibacillus]MDH6429762.1 hypothetical protein [Paenibacillus sp. PastH-4]MDH6446139.1 hypothetical protein [Paenibacillus sp. PastF-4]MDH6530392.1 hypothetical protein [Paenibacillus sp. PastH-3]OMD38682.1 hypothetical protein BSO21_03600 [Paenibacillus odorifer]OMD60404.1 hypothetical protein BSK55_09010 [Paenibacillus odorifer]
MRKIASVAAVFAFVLMVGCGNATNNANNATATSTPENTNNAGTTNNTGTANNQNNTTDAVTSASVVDNEEAFKRAISPEGTWIAATLKDLTFTEDLVVDGEFMNKEEPARKIALYTQDADHNITNSFKLTAPKLTIKSKNARIQGGTFIGDVYVEADGFTLVNATVEGNVYFANDQYKSTFNSSDQGKVTGVTEVKK